MSIEKSSKPAESLPLDDIQLSTWYWVKDSESPEKERLGCVTHIGSNHVVLTYVSTYKYTEKILFSVFDARCRLESDPDSYIKSRQEHYQNLVQKHMEEIKQLTASLCLNPSTLLQGDARECSALATLDQGQNLKDYGQSLVKAKEETLPDLFEKIKSANEKLSNWMVAGLIPLRNQSGQLRSLVSSIENRIFSVELYAGLVDTVTQIQEGAPAEPCKLAVFQRMHYMDEECLARYEVGGMDMKDIESFNSWLCKPANLDRILPFQRCIVAFRVRRETKHREWSSIYEFLSVIQQQQDDKTTFLYIRNGAQVYMLETAIDFGTKLFPDMTQSNQGKHWYRETGADYELISDNEYQQILKDREEACEKWKQDNKLYQRALKSSLAKQRAKEKGLRHGPDATCVNVPWPGPKPSTSPWDRYIPYSPDNVHYDDINRRVLEDLTKHNRIVLILQGLLDRSPVLHPHPSHVLWTSEGFSEALELICDDSKVLTTGAAPDFEAYRKRLNASLAVGSITVGQEDAWELFEGEKESKRRDKDYRYRSEYRPDRWTPYGNPGPGTIAKLASFSKKTQKCGYVWKKKRIRHNPYGPDTPLNTSFSCPADQILNVSAYTPGDFRQFYDDPRTRADYLKWAPLLLLAEEYHAGNISLSSDKESSID